MQFNDRPDELKRGGPNLRVACLIEFACQLLYAFTLRAKLAAPRCCER